MKKREIQHTENELFAYDPYAKTQVFDTPDDPEDADFLQCLRAYRCSPDLCALQIRTHGPILPSKRATSRTMYSHVELSLDQVEALQIQLEKIADEIRARQGIRKPQASDIDDAVRHIKMAANVIEQDLNERGYKDGASTVGWAPVVGNLVVAKTWLKTWLKDREVKS